VVGGSYLNTQSRDEDAYETITEVLSAPNKNAYSKLIYDSTQNADGEGDSDGTTITILR